jgi:hypothetical protein
VLRRPNQTVHLHRQPDWHRDQLEVRRLDADLLPALEQLELEPPLRRQVTPHCRLRPVVLGCTHQAVNPHHSPDRRLLGVQLLKALHHRHVAQFRRHIPARQAVDGLETDIAARPGQRLRAV